MTDMSCCEQMAKSLICDFISVDNDGDVDKSSPIPTMPFRG
jgi:hypothetical protein